MYAENTESNLRHLPEVGVVALIGTLPGGFCDGFDY